MHDNTVNDEDIRREQTLALLHETERRLTEAQETARIGSWEYDCSTGIFTWSKETFRLLQFDPQDGVPDYEALRKRYHPDDLSFHDEIIRLAFSRGTSYGFDLRAILPDGSLCWLHAQGRSVRNEQGAIVRLVGTLQDITERKVAEEEREAVLKRFETAMSSSRSGVWRWNFVTKDRYRSPDWKVILGYTGKHEAEAPNDVLEIFHPDDRTKMEEETIPNFLKSQEVFYETEFRVQHRNGNWCWFLSRAWAERLPDGNVISLTGIYTEITERKQGEEEREQTLQTLAEREEQLRALSDNLPNGFVYQIVKHPDKMPLFVYVSAGVDRLMGVRPEEILADSTLLYAMLLEEDRDSLREREKIVARDVAPFDYEARYVNPTGEIRWLNLRSTPRYLSSGTLLWDGIALDVTERKRLEEEKERLRIEAIERSKRDPLTNLYNHHTFHLRLEETFDQARREGLSFSVVALDMDNFKFFNDAYGHLVGDQVLSNIAQALQKLCPETGLVARVGGDEFAILLPRLSSSERQHFTDRLRNVVRQLAYRPESSASAIPLRLSLGIATYPEDGTNLSDLLYMADKRALLDKSSGFTESAEEVRRQLRKANDSFSLLDALISAIDTKDRYTRRHSDEVMLICRYLGDELQLSEEEREQLLIGSLLHDVGKVGIAGPLLRHPGNLALEELLAIRQHTILGDMIVAAAPGMDFLRPVVRNHHERWDGKGYPDGLKGGEIPRIARIVAVADALSAMTSDRPYRRSLSFEAALEILREGAGTQWDPFIVDALHSARQSISTSLVRE